MDCSKILRYIKEVIEVDPSFPFPGVIPTPPRDGFECLFKSMEKSRYLNEPSSFHNGLSYLNLIKLFLCPSHCRKTSARSVIRG